MCLQRVSIPSSVKLACSELKLSKCFRTIATWINLIVILFGSGISIDVVMLRCIVLTFD